MNEEQFEKDRRNRWAQTRLIANRLKEIRKAIELWLALIFVILFALFMMFVTYLLNLGGG